MKLTDIITKDAPLLNKNRPLLDALESLNKQGLESVGISDESKPIGTLSYHDILFRIGAQRLRAVDPASLYISGFVKEFPAILSNDTSVRKAAKLMIEFSSYALPMMYGETFLGMVYRRSMLQLVQGSSVALSTIMKRNFPTIRSHDRVIRARTMLLENGISILPVVNEENRLMGITTEKEVLNSLIEFQKYVPEKNQKARIRQLPVSSAMRVGVPEINGSLTLGEASMILSKESLPALVVLESSKVAGVVSTTEILEYIVESFQEQ
jgi:predicted transcriptional regulator